MKSLLLLVPLFIIGCVSTVDTSQVRAERLAYEEKLREEQKELREEQKKIILENLISRCEEYGFQGESNIADCIRREAQFDKLIAEAEETRLITKAYKEKLQREKLQSEDSVAVEEDIPLLIKFLGDIVIGVAEAYPEAMQRARLKQEAYNRGVRRGEENQRVRCNNQQGNC